MSSLFHRYVGWRLDRLAQRCVDRGLPPRWVGYRRVKRESLEEYMSRRGGAAGEAVETIQPERVFRNPLPRNVDVREALSRDSGWWGYSMYDVPSRQSAPTLQGTLTRARVLPWIDPEVGYFRPAILTRDHSSLELREISFRSVHGRRLRSVGPSLRVERATWILERVYDNHSHWLTAHLPKLLLLRDRGELSEVLMPRQMTQTMASSMEMLGIDPQAFPTFDFERRLDVERLTILSTDRFRPDLLRPVRAALASTEAPPTRRVFISRARAGRRRLLNEAEVWPLLEGEGFERVFMEDMEFRRQVALMQETAVVVAPHGAGLTNMMFCPEGATIVEIADPGFPNPNFYALAAAMGHDYWLVPGQAVGDVHPLEKDLMVELPVIEDLLASIASVSRSA